MIELRWLQKKAQQFDAGFPQYEHILQYRTQMTFYNGGPIPGWSSWKDVPTEIEGQTSEGA
jgi:hypothetical protein